MKHMKKLFALVLALSLIASALCMESLATVVDSGIDEGSVDGKYWIGRVTIDHDGIYDSVIAKTSWAGTGLKEVKVTADVEYWVNHKMYSHTSAALAKGNNSIATCSWTSPKLDTILHASAVHKIKGKIVGRSYASF